jgi:hypothetical protein
MPVEVYNECSMCFLLSQITTAEINKRRLSLCDIDSQERLGGYQGRLMRRNRKGGNTDDEIKKVVD